MPRTIATNSPVDLNGLLDFIRPRHHHLLMTTRAPTAVPKLVAGHLRESVRGRWADRHLARYPERAKSGEP